METDPGRPLAPCATAAKTPSTGAGSCDAPRLSAVPPWLVASCSPRWPAPWRPPLETLGIGEDSSPPPRPPAPGGPPRASAPPGGVRRPGHRVPVPRGAPTRRSAPRTGPTRPIRKLIVHHTASPTNPQDPASWVRKTYEFHVLGRGYSDVGYNFLIDHRGNDLRGPLGSELRPRRAHDGDNPDGLGVIGGHALGMNTGTWASASSATSRSASRTQAAMNSLIRLLAWECAVHKIDPMGVGPLRAASRAREVVPEHLRPQGRRPDDLPRADGVQPVPRHPPASGPWSARSRPRPSTSTRHPVQLRRPRPPSLRAASLTGMVGYRILTNDGRVRRLGQAGKARSPRDEGVTDALAIAPAPGTTATTRSTSGGVLAFGTAKWFGSLRSTGQPLGLCRPRAARRKGDGYWVLAANGGVFPFGAATWFGSLSSTSGRTGPRKIRATPRGNGYWILSATAGCRPSATRRRPARRPTTGAATSSTSRPPLPAGATGCSPTGVWPSATPAPGRPAARRRHRHRDRAEREGLLRPRGRRHRDRLRRQGVRRGERQRPAAAGIAPAVV